MAYLRAPSRRRAELPALWVAGGIATGLVLIVALAALPPWQLHDDADGARLVLETVDGVTLACIAAIASARLSTDASRREWVLVASLVLLAAATLGLVVAPSTIGQGDSDLVAWAPAVVRLVAAIGLLGAAVGRRDWWWRTTWGGGSVIAPIVLVVVVAAFVLVVALGAFLLTPLLPSVASGAGETLAERITNHRIFASLQLVGFVVLAAACAAFARQAYASRETMMRCLAGVAAIAAVARLSSIGDPSVVSTHLYPSDAVRIASYLVLGVLGAREMVSYRRRLAAALVAEERRRLACELHDGLTQELAFIASKAQAMLEEGATPRGIGSIASAADRALIESRCAIATLNSDDDSLTARITRTAEALAGREGAHARFTVQEGVDASAPVTEALVRIVGEAVTNAIRHGGVDTVEVRLSRDDKLRLVVQDRGRGFDPQIAAPGRLGITTMRQRAMRVGGEMHIRSRPGAGTQIEVVIP